MKILTFNLCVRLPGHSAKSRLDKVKAFARLEDVGLVLTEGVTDHRGGVLAEW